MEIDRQKRPGLKTIVILSMLIILIVSIGFIALISSFVVLRLGNISVSIAEKDITSEYINYVKTLMDRKAKEYFHVVELGLKFAGIYASKAGFLYDNISDFEFDKKKTSGFYKSFTREKNKGFYYSTGDGVTNISAAKGGIEDLKYNQSLYYALSLYNPFLDKFISDSRRFDYSHLIIYDSYYQIFFTRDNLLNISLVGNADSLRADIDRSYDLSSSQKDEKSEVTYKYRSLGVLDALCCTVKFFREKDNKLVLSSSIGINKKNLTDDMEREELSIISSLQDIGAAEEFAKKYVFTFVFDEETSEFVILPAKAVGLLGFNLSPSDPEERFYAFNSSENQIRDLSIRIAGKKEKSGQFFIKIKNMPYIFIYQRFDDVKWILFTAIPYSILEKPASETRKEMFSIIYDFNSDFVTLSIILFAISSGITIFIFRKHIIIPIKGFNDRAMKMSCGNFGVSVIARGPKELYDLGIAFNELSGELRTYMKNLEYEIEARSHLDSEMDIAGKIQQSMLPGKNIIADDQRFEIISELIPAKEVAGDFYDFMKFNENKMMFLIADVSGKGISAAFFMSIAKSVIRNACVSEPDDPSKAIRLANNQLARFGTQMFVTVFLCYLDLITGEIKYANAGHNEALMLSAYGKARYFGKMGNAIAGFIEDMDFKMGQDVINPGEIMILYTDGVTEATSVSEELFGDERLMEIVELNYGSELKILVSEIIHAVEFFDKGNHSDDITILAIRRNKA